MTDTLDVMFDKLRDARQRTTTTEAQQIQRRPEGSLG
jgi:hypothetical protein